MDKYKLKPCPFCGGQPVFESYYTDANETFICIECSKCGIQVFQDDTKELIRFWNTRA